MGEYIEYIEVNARKELFEKERYSRPARYSRAYIDEYIKNKNEPPILREARSEYAFWNSAELSVFESELIVGKVCSHEPAGFHYGGGTWISRHNAEKLAEQDNYTDQQKTELSAMLEEVEIRRYGFPRAIFTSEEFNSIESHAATSTWFGGHMVIDFEMILELGLCGYKNNIEFYKNKNADIPDSSPFYEAMETELEAVRSFILRLSDKCREVSERSGGNNRNLIAIADNLKFIADNPPNSFWQAIQLVWIVYMLNGCDSFGRFDCYLTPFYDSDIKNGILTKDEAKALIVDFWLKIEEVEQIQNMTIGGRDEDGNSFYSDITFLCLSVTRELLYKGPNLCLRMTADMPEHIWNEAMLCIGTGVGLPALYNDKIYSDSLVRSGIDEKTARGYCLAGCSQLIIPGQSNFANDIGMFNVGKIAELTMYDGYDTRTDKQTGIRTGKAEDFISFEDLWQAFFRQLEYFVDIETSIHNKEIIYRNSREGYALRTLFIRGCIESGKTVFDGGARYNNIELEIIGITNAADHFYAINKLVFDNKKYTMAEICHALENNWQGYETIRADCINTEKFGNGSVEIDNMRKEITEYLYKRFNDSKAALGGIFVPGEVIFTAHEHSGYVTGATYDGRYKGEVLADSAGASNGYDRNGATALMNSILKLPVDSYLLTSVVTNIKFMPQLFKSAKTRKGIQSLFESFFKQGGMQLQVNVCDAEELKAARKNPEQHRNLVVRVGGYSDYFIRLSPTLQDEIIARTEHRF